MHLPTIDRGAATSYARGREHFKKMMAGGIVPACSGGYIAGGCSAGHKFAAPYLCGKEFCPDCGRDGSPIHGRRLNRWQHLVKDWAKLGYLVITLPEEIRPFFFNKGVLKDFRYQLRRKLQRDGIKEGLARWHWFGDCETCRGAGCSYCNDTGSGTIWHPHLNVFIRRGYMPPAELQTFITGLQRWTRNYYLKLITKEIEAREELLNRTGSSLANAPEVWEDINGLQAIIINEKKRLPVIHYSYTADPVKIINRLKYVLRSTFRIYHKETREQLHNFRNCVRWGFGRVKGESGLIYCPTCKTKHHENAIHWTNREKYHNKLKYINYDEGIYTLYTGSSGGGRALQYATKRTGRKNKRLFARRENFIKC